MIGAVVLDLDGVLLESEGLWDAARHEVVRAHGGRWTTRATADMQGMSAPEWSAYLQGLGVPLDPGAINQEVVEALLARYRAELPLLPGAAGAVRRLAARWPLAIASSSNRVVIDAVLSQAGLAGELQVVVSSEEVARGKPAPDVYLEAARRLAQPPSRCAAVEDSANGVRAALAAGMRVVALPSPEFPPPAELLSRVDRVVGSLDALTVELFEALEGEPPGRDPGDRLDEEERESFPASDPHAEWSGPPA